MKIFLLVLLTGFLFTTDALAQDSWTVQLDKKVLLKVFKEDTTMNVVSLKNIKKSNLVIKYHEPKRKDWSRTLLVYDDGDNELYRKDGYTATFSAAVLKKWAKKHKQVKVYTFPRNLNPAIAIKVRRVHLCTIKFD